MKRMGTERKAFDRMQTCTTCGRCFWTPLGIATECSDECAHEARLRRAAYAALEHDMSAARRRGGRT